MRTHTGEKPHKCHLCSRTFRQSQSLKIHLHTHKCKGVCIVCEAEFEDRNELNKHITVHTAEEVEERSKTNDERAETQDCKVNQKAGKEKRFACKDCGKKYSTMSTLKIHRTVHSKETPYVCTICGKGFKYKYTLPKHMQLMHSGKQERPYGCDLCGKSFKQKGHLNDHMNRHNGQKPFSCPVCALQVSTGSALKKHLTRQHKQPDVEAKNAEPEQQETEDLNSAVSDKSASAEHKEHDSGNREVTEAEKPFKCEQCYRCFPTKIKLEMHSVVHLLPPYKCKICGKSMKSKYSLPKHMLTMHFTGQEKPFRCSGCSKSFRLKQNLKKHSRTHISDRPFKCEVCGLGFTLKSSLRKHLLIHASKHSCRLCEQVFENKVGLFIHSKTHGDLDQSSSLSSSDNAFKAATAKDFNFYSCDICEARFLTTNARDNHLQQIHGRTEYKSESKILTRKFRSGKEVSTDEVPSEHSVLTYTDEISEYGGSGHTWKEAVVNSPSNRRLAADCVSDNDDSADTVLYENYSDNLINSMNSVRDSSQSNKSLSVEHSKIVNKRSHEVESQKTVLRRESTSDQRNKATKSAKILGTKGTLQKAKQRKTKQNRKDKCLRRTGSLTKYVSKSKVINSDNNSEFTKRNPTSQNVKRVKQINSKRSPVLVKHTSNTSVEADKNKERVPLSDSANESVVCVIDEQMNHPSDRSLELIHLLPASYPTNESVEQVPVIDATGEKVETGSGQQTEITTNEEEQIPDIPISDSGSQNIEMVHDLPPSSSTNDENVEVFPICNSTVKNIGLIVGEPVSDSNSENENTSLFHRLNTSADENQPICDSTVEEIIQCKSDVAQTSKLSWQQNCAHLSEERLLNSSEIEDDKTDESNFDISNICYDPITQVIQQHLETEEMKPVDSSKLIPENIVSSFVTEDHDNSELHRSYQSMSQPSPCTQQYQLVHFQANSDLLVTYTEAGKTSTAGHFSVKDTEGQNVKKLTMFGQALKPIKEYSCTECHLVFTNITKYNRHMRKHPEARPKPYMCEQCGKTFAEKRNLLDHLITHSDIRPYTCDICGWAFKIKSNMIKHLLTHNQPEKLVCQYCGERFSHLSYLNEHMLVHSKGRLYECDICHKVFTHQNYLQKHLRRHSSVKPHQCRYCGKGFKEVTHLREHLVIHTGERRFHCSVCEKKFAQKGQLNNHMKIHTGDKPHQCPVCGRRFRQSQGLKLHLTTHAYKCKICGQSFSEQGQLDDHQMDRHAGQCDVDTFVHTAGKDNEMNGKIDLFICPICSKTVSSKGNLNRHIASHAKVKPYHCQLCDRSYTDSRTLIQHQAVHNGVKPYVCSLCGKNFAWKSNWRTHQKVHSKVESFSCQQCGKVLKSHECLEKHMEAVHDSEDKRRGDV